ncbi:sugar isomerase [Conexibacter sp. JD483]|uniref:SIS domain-containing protein n=1 Tax=unclassified Conexibacter TaxID=2627773 RepID=UPI00272536A2|nr:MULTISPECIES: sugar isomerase [unclassified Conexibacter]MDO8184275.1 sugar isomerase [Conexibacter sp. CPCC 205706]MDO8197581.1 sugar isomerase [Conexibacter sp. CPCC 205762]MDR9371042.1 sugar isomerase [Conexibacter sp. JD483]
MSITSDEISTQPADWRRAVSLAEGAAELLPAAGERVAVVGCGTSLFMAQAYAALREGAGLGETDAFAASELPEARCYDVLVAITRSGTTSEVTRVLQRSAAARTVALTAVVDTPVGAAAGAVIDLGFADERSVVQTRFATTALALLRAQVEPEAVLAAADDAQRALELPLPLDPGAVEQWSFLGLGWTVGLAHEAALKLREAAQAWAESYNAFEYRHGPISVAAPGRVVWSMSALDAAIVEQIGSTGANLVVPELDPMASLVLAQRAMLGIAEARGLNPDTPRNLTRSVVLSEEELEVLT